MNIYLLTQNVNKGWDTWDSIVVVAKDEQEARMTHPRYSESWSFAERYKNWNGIEDSYGGWCNASKVEVKLIGKALEGMERQVLCASFNAG